MSDLLDNAVIPEGRVLSIDVFRGFAMPLFIFLFARSGGADWFLTIVRPFADILLGRAGSGPAQAGTALGALALMCLLCLALYKKGLFLKI